MAKITQTITNFPTPPDSSNDTPTEFNTKADAFVNHQGSVYTTEVNTWATQANGLKDDMNVIKTDIDNTVATIPAGSINDGQISNKKVWSSAKTNNVLNQKQNIDPKFGIESFSEPAGAHGILGWTKFPDGTAMYYYSNYETPSGAQANLPYTGIAFISPPSVVVTIARGSFAQKNYYGQPGIDIASNNTNCRINKMKFDGSDTSDGIFVNLQAIGRWK